MIFSGKASEEFNVKALTNKQMEAFIDMCANIYHGVPEWADDNVKTINFAKSICEEIARLTTLAIGIKVEGSARAEWLQKQIDNVYFLLREWVEYGCAYGTIILKPNGEDIDLVFPTDYMVTSQSNKRIDGCVFVNRAQSNDGKTYYTRLEYHRFIDDTYVITNKCYKGNTKNDTSISIPIEESPWDYLQEEVAIKNLDRPLFAVLKTPNANNIDMASPLGLPAFASAIEELKDLDVAYSRNSEEIFDSERIVLLDSDKLIPKKGFTDNTRVQKNVRETMELPKYVRNVVGNGTSDFYQEINPSLNTSTRIEGINNLLSQIGFKCGFSNGYFVFDEKTGMITATQVEADDRRTIHLIKDMRDKLESCINELLYALNAFADLYGLAPLGAFEAVFDFGDITYSREEDRARWWGYVQSGKVPAWMYFVKFEGMTEEEAKGMTSEAEGQREPFAE